VLGVSPQRGRVFNAELDKPGDTPVVVISNRFWRNRLNSSPDAVGQTLRLNGQPATIVVSLRKISMAPLHEPRGAIRPDYSAAALAPELANDVLHQRNAREFLALICLAPGVTIDSQKLLWTRSHVSLTSRIRQLQHAPTKATRDLTLGGTMVRFPEFEPVVIGFYVVLMGYYAHRLMNLGNMLLARAPIAGRVAIPGNRAGRFRLVRQMMSECMLLSLLGAL